MRTVLITGGSRGIGAATARAFAQNGDRVIINYQSSHQLANSLAEELGGIAICADVSDKAQVQAMLAQIGGVDVLVNNAGISQKVTVADMTLNDMERILDAIKTK